MAHMYMHSSNDGSSHVGVDALRSEIRLRSDDATSSSDGRAHPIGIAAATSAEPPHPFVRLPRRDRGSEADPGRPLTVHELAVDVALLNHIVLRAGNEDGAEVHG